MLEIFSQLRSNQEQILQPEDVTIFKKLREYIKHAGEQGLLPRALRSRSSKRFSSGCALVLKVIGNIIYLCHQLMGGF